MATARCTWTAVSGVDGYNVYLKSNGEFVKQNSELITETVYDIENLEDGNYEAYATSVLNSVESEASNTRAFNVGDVQEAEIFTTAAGGNYQSGNTFILNVGSNAVFIDALDFSLRTGTDNVHVYYREGAPVYSQDGSWILHEEKEFVGNNNGNVDQRFEFDTPIQLNPNTQYSFFVVRSSGTIDMNYTNGNQTINADGDLQYVSDRGVTTVAFGQTFADRQWNGRILYRY